MSRHEKDKDLILAWVTLLEGLGIKLSWSPNTDELYSTPALSLACEKKTDLQISEDLTPREQQVFQWILKGKSSREIAVVLGVSFRTIEKHSQRIYSKAGVHGRSGLFKDLLPQNERKEQVVASPLARRERGGVKIAGKTLKSAKEHI